MTLSDAPARDRAQREFSRPLLLQAGAGTGKTATLVNRLLAWCLTTGWTKNSASLAGNQQEIAAQTLRRVTALTFSEAAAREMEGRFLEALDRLASGTSPVGLAELDLASPNLRRRAARLRAAAVHLQIRTLHSFCMAVLSRHPFEARLPVGFSIDADGSITRILCERLIAEEVAQNQRSVPHHLEALLIQGSDPTEIAKTLGLLALESGALPELDLDISDLCERGLHLCLELGSLLARRRVRPAARNARSIENALTTLRPRLQSALDTSRLLSIAEIQKWFSTALSPSYRRHIKGWSSGVLANKEEIRALNGVSNDLRELSATFSNFVDHLLQLDLERLTKVHRATRHYLTQLKVRQQEEGILSFQDLGVRALELLQSSPKIRQRLRESMDQILIDELQDTDRVQLEILTLLGLGDRSRPSPGLFAVGDAKQSIYSWRNADLEAYETFAARIVELGGDNLLLMSNFRSRPEILKFVDHTIGPMMKARPGIQPQFVGLEAAARSPTLIPSIEQWLCWVPDQNGSPRLPPSVEADSIEAKAVARDLLELVATSDTQWSEIAILSRTGQALSLFAKTLREHGIPYRAADDGSYFGRREIIDASSLVITILDNRDQLALTTFLRSSMVGVPDAALEPLFDLEILEQFGQRAAFDDRALLDRLEELERSVHDQLPQLKEISGWSQAFVHAHQGVDHLRSVWKEDTVCTFVAELRRIFPFEFLAAAEESSQPLSNIARFSTELSDLLETTGADLGLATATLRKWCKPQPHTDRSQPLDSSREAVSLLTIHAAKGLEFSHVYLVQLSRRSAREGQSSSRIEVLADRSVFRLFGCPSPGFDRWQSQRTLEQQAELVRTFYVALTRAKQRVVLVRRRSPATTRARPSARRSKPAETYEELLVANQPEPEQLLEQWHESVVSRSYSGSLWRFPWFSTSNVEKVSQRADPAVPGQPFLESDIQGWQEHAVKRMSQSPYLAASARSIQHALHPPQTRSRVASEDLPDSVEKRFDQPIVARVVGASIHQWIQQLDLNQPIDDQLSEVSRLFDQNSKDARLTTQRQEAEARLETLMARLRRGTLLPRLFALGHRVSARELPVILSTAPAATDSPHIRGVIDLLYYDQQRQSPVVVDFKTDWLDDQLEDTRSESATLIQQANRYRHQAQMYATAIQSAFDLAEIPRVELWFLATDRIVVGSGRIEIEDWALLGESR